MIDPEISNSRTIVAITSVDLKNMTFEGKAVVDRPKQIKMTLLPGTTWAIPSVGEQWMVQRDGIKWYLLAKLNFQDPRGLLPQTEGMFAYGGKGETHIVGKQVSVHAPLFVEGEELRAPSQKVVEVSTPDFTLSGEAPAIVPLSSTEAGLGMVAVTVGGRGESNTGTYALDITLSGQTKTVVVPPNTNPYFSETFFLLGEEITGVSFTARPTAMAQVSGLTVRITSL